jgi:predicted O-methyltransferase YrrM
MGITITVARAEELLISTGVGEVRVHVGRKTLPDLFAARGYTTGAEIGVWHGKFSSKLKAANPALTLLCVDAWQSFHGYVDTKASTHMAEAEAAARALLEPMGCDIRKGTSVDIAATVPDRSLDFVYIDADHSKRAVLEDLRAWAPKVKSGGVISGHDYCVNPDRPFIQVIDAVREFTADTGIQRWFALTADRTPSFYWVNP